MFVHFSFKNDSNPYIAKTTRETFRMLCKYECFQVGPYSFIALRESESYISRKHNREYYKAMLREIAIYWQFQSEIMQYSYEELSNWLEFFIVLGKQYGLLREFHENAIC